MILRQYRLRVFMAAITVLPYPQWCRHYDFWRWALAANPRRLLPRPKKCPSRGGNGAEGDVAPNLGSLFHSSVCRCAAFDAALHIGVRRSESGVWADHSASVGQGIRIFNMTRAMSFLALIIVLFSFPLPARQASDENVIAADTADTFVVLVDKIRGQMATGQRYEFLSKNDRNLVDGSLDKMSVLLNASGSVDAMSKAERISLFNEQERANGILARNADDRIICTREAPIGSHRPTTTCKTYREIEELRKSTQLQLRDMTKFRDNPFPNQ